MTWPEGGGGEVAWSTDASSASLGRGRTSSSRSLNDAKNYMRLKLRAACQGRAHEDAADQHREASGGAVRDMFVLLRTRVRCGGRME